MSWNSGTDFRNKDGSYTWKDRNYYGVTTVLDKFLSGNAAYARAAMVANRAVELATLAKNGEVAIIPKLEYDDDLNAFWSAQSADPMELLTDAQHLRSEMDRQRYRDLDRGTCGHLLLASWLNNELYALPDVAYWTEHTIIDKGLRCDPEDCIVGNKAFLQWLNEFQPVAVAYDFPVWHDGLGYAGTPDVIWGIDDYVDLCDMKFSKATGINHEAQVAAYDMAEYMGFRGSDKRTRKPKLDRRAVLLIDRESGKATYRTFPNKERGNRLWRNLLAAYKIISAPFKADTQKGKVSKLDPMEMVRMEVTE